MSLHPDKKSIQNIVFTIQSQEAALRRKYTFLKYQNALGLSCLFLSLVGMLSVAWCYAMGFLMIWQCIILSALFASISHEIEHDLIHKLYFSNKPIIHNAMMLIVWLMRPNTVNPWYRRKIHLHHHKTSGTKQDLEERLVGNGVRNPLLRLVINFDGLIGLLIHRRRLKKEVRCFNFWHVFHAGFPVATFYFVALYGFVIFQCIDYFTDGNFSYPDWLLIAIDNLSFLMVVLIGPNILRSFCLNFITSNMHYYGGVKNLMQQTQILNHWLFYPCQLFCFNFGNTHSIHHFVPKQPFYIRQWISKQVNVVMYENGVRENDLASIKRANRYNTNPQ